MTGFKRESVAIFQHPDAPEYPYEWALCEVDDHGIRRWAYRLIIKTKIEQDAKRGG